MAKRDTVKSIDSVSDLFNFLFEACNILRGPVSQDNFKDYITPILYYKRISDVYDEETEAALEESGGDLEYASLPEQHRFFIPEGCRWSDVRKRSENLGAAIVGAMRKIELAHEVPRLQKIPFPGGCRCNRGNVFSQKGLFPGRDCK